MDSKQKIFKKGSKTYYNSSKFFPKHIREEVTILYAFVRTVDNYVDAIPQQKEEFYRIKQELATRQGGKASGNPLVDDFVSLAEEREFKKEWISAFMDSMEFDLTGNICKTKKEMDTYIYGAAEVIGLFMANIMQLPKESHKEAKALGYSMQLINFIRDIREDIELKRWYLSPDYTQHKITQFNKEYFESHQEEFSKFLKEYIKIYYKKNKEALKGLRFMRKSVRIPIKVASTMYEWTAKQIEKNPMIVFEKKVKPQKWRIIVTYLQISMQEAFK